MIFFAMSVLMALFDSQGLRSVQSNSGEPDSRILELPKANRLAIANNEFAFKLQKTYGFDGNTFSSPASIFIALGMLYIGSRGSTREEIRSTLSYGLAGINDDTINRDFQTLLLSFVDTSGLYKLEVANALLLQDKFQVSKVYKKDLMKFYGAKVKEVDFMAEKEKILQEVNDWVKNKTHGRIVKLLETIDSDTVLMLLNAVYFKGKWIKQFHPYSTRERTFYNNGINAIRTPTMIIESHFLYGKFPEYRVQALKMQYVGGKMSMVVLLPLSRTGLREVEEELNATKLQNIIARLEDENVIVQMPKFNLEDSRELKRSLVSLGMRSPFSNSANFGGINNDANLKVTKVMHKAMVEVNEVGTVASGATSIEASPRMIEEAAYFTVEHPFLYFIVDDETGMMIFFGRINAL